jgi:hypothetical protein
MRSLVTRRLLGILSALLMLTAGAQATDLDAAAVAGAKTIGEDGNARVLLVACTSTKMKESFRHPGNPVVEMRISGPRGDIAMKAAEAKRLYQPLQISDDMTAWHLTVLAHPQTVGVIQSIAIRGAAGGAVAADTFVPGPPLRGTIDAVGIFTSGAAQVIAGTGDFQIVAVTNAGERSCDVDAKARARLGF